MDSPPVPKPRTALIVDDDPKKRPVPLPRTKLSNINNNDKVSASDILRSISSVSKQITEDVTTKVQSSAKSANEKLEKTISDGSRFAKDTLEKTLSTSRAMRDSVTKSVIEGTKTAGFKLRRNKKLPNDLDNSDRCVSMPVVDVSLFDNIQFHSPLLEQKRYSQHNTDEEHSILPVSLNSTFDDLSLVSSNFDSNTDTLSNFSYDSRETDNNHSGLIVSSDYSTYDTPNTTSRSSSISTSIITVPEVPERRKKRDSYFEFQRQNSLYENWNLPIENKLENTNPFSRASKSMLVEFDPLNTSTSKFEGVSNELILLESFLVGDTYGTIISNATDDYFEEIGENDYFNPPTPPERSDSLLIAEETHQETPSEIKNAKKQTTSKWFDKRDDSEEKLVMTGLIENNKSTNASVMRKVSNILKLDNMLSKPVKQNSANLENVARPPLNTVHSFYNGLLTRVTSGAVEEIFRHSQVRYCVLADQKFMCYSDISSSMLKEVIELESIYSLQIVLPLSSSTTNNSYWFEFTMSGGAQKNSHRKVCFSCNSASERRSWAQKIVEHLTSAFPTKYTAEFTRCGWCYLKEGVSGEWHGAWVMLIRRLLVYYSTSDCVIKTVDLRKTRCVVTQEADEFEKSFCSADGIDNLLLDCPDATLYLRFQHERELKAWSRMIKLAAHNNGVQLHHQQLTKDNVPTIVDKCISFIYAHGSLSEGIYRRAGSSSLLTELLARFRRDAWSVQLSPSTHSEHDIAGILKRFFRDLPEPLIPQELHENLLETLANKDKEARHSKYSQLMIQMPIVPRMTIRKLFAHLHFLQTLSHSNKMSAENLASVWAPTIMPAALTSNTLQTAWSTKEVYVIRELISEYESIWQPTEAERRREQAIRCVLLRVAGNAAPSLPRAAGHLRTWICVKDRSKSYQVALTPTKKCSDLCIELCEKAEMESHVMMLEEVVCNESMRRIVHMDEIVLNVVLRWGYWDEEDRKDNYLLIRENQTLQEMEALRTNISLVCAELKFTNDSSKAFKLRMFELKNSKLCYFKDKQGSHQLGEWNIKDILWYVGYEPKRNPQCRWAITFIPKTHKPNRTKERPWFGCTIAGSVNEDQLRWMAAMMFAEHTTILPTPRLVIT